jgi:2',3'-cyclic-nucleotide 2'-phosphodiesterase (5'-nucleotidase family)
MPYEPTQKYQVVINNFMAEGGNGYCMLKDATRIEYDGKNLLTDLVVDEITSITTITEQPPRIINASN